MIAILYPPYEDELSYSWFARNHRILGNSFRDTGIEFFGIYRPNLYVLFQRHLDFFAKQIPKDIGIDLETIVKNHTLIPFFRLFLDYYDKKDIFIHEFGTLNRPVGIADNHVIKMCPLCCDEDKGKHGEIYIHRSHQAPGNKVCLKHETRLIELDYSQRKFLDLAGIDHKSFKIEYINREFDSIYYDLSKDANFILNGGLSNHNLQMIQDKYLQKLSEMGYRNGKVTKLERVKRDFISFYGEKILDEFNLNISIDKKRTWLDIFLTVIISSKNPIKHLLLIKFLFGGAKEFADYNLNYIGPFGSGPWPCLNKICHNYNKNVIEDPIFAYNNHFKCISGRFECKCGYTYGRSEKNDYIYLIQYGHEWKEKLRKYIVEDGKKVTEISRRLNCAKKSILLHAEAMGLLEVLCKRYYIKFEYRNKITEYLANNKDATIKKIKSSYKNEFKHLERHDKIWLDEALFRVRDKKTKWLKLDEEINCSILLTIKEIIDKDEPKKINKYILSSVMGGWRIYKTDCLESMPKTKETLELYCETEEQFQHRLNQNKT